MPLGVTNFQVPDVDAVIQFQDLPRVPSSRSATSGPLFCYASNDLFLDIPFPDFSYWGNMAHNQPAIWQVSATIVVSGNLAVKAVHLPAKLILRNHLKIQAGSPDQYVTRPLHPINSWLDGN